MPLTNTHAAYGSIAKTFHWSIGLGILAMICLGFVAKALPADTSAEIAVKAQLFTLHKTVGLALLALALLRIGWAVTQHKPAPATDDDGPTLFLATLAHWLLYALLILVPLSGWLHHAATTGFAPIAWPFGQSLPFVPKDPGIAEIFATLHFALIVVLCVTLLAHIAGALKHHLIDRDDTLRRMLPGRPPVNMPTMETPRSYELLAPITAIAVLGIAIGLSVAPGVRSAAAIPPTLSAQSDVSEPASQGPTWRIEDGEIAITIRQMGTAVSGSFADWSAAIVFADEPTDDVHGTVAVSIGVPSLTLGSVSTTAQEPDYFDGAAFPIATFEAVLRPAEGEGSYLADGTLTIKGTSVPMEIPFSLDIEGNTGVAALSTTLDRRDFRIGLGQTDEGTLGFGVDVAVSVIALRDNGS